MLTDSSLLQMLDSTLYIGCFNLDGGESFVKLRRATKGVELSFY